MVIGLADAQVCFPPFAVVQAWIDGDETHLTTFQVDNLKPDDFIVRVMIVRCQNY